MGQETSKSNWIDELRQQLKTFIDDPAPASATQVAAMIRALDELQTDQAALELQNQELRQAHQVLEASEKRLAQINAVLTGLRQVSKVIVNEPNRDRMLQRACDLLVHERGFYNVWIALLDHKRKIHAVYSAGPIEEGTSFRDQLLSEKLPHCIREALEQPGLVIIEDPAQLCAPCPLSCHSDNHSGLTRRLEADGIIYGVMTFSAPQDYIRNWDHLSVLDELAHDISFGLRNIERAEEANRWHRVMMGRENRIMELKDEVNHLLRKAGLPPRYGNT